MNRALPGAIPENEKIRPRSSDKPPVPWLSLERHPIGSHRIPSGRMCYPAGWFL